MITYKLVKFLVLFWGLQILLEITIPTVLNRVATHSGYSVDTG